MPRQFDKNKVPENMMEVAANTTEAHHIYRNYLKTKKVVEWFNMCVDAQKGMAPQQFYFRYLMRDTTGGPRHPDDKLSPEADPFGFGDMNKGLNGRKKKITENWALNVSAALFDEVAAKVMANDWSEATWKDIYEKCQLECIKHEETIYLFKGFKNSQFFPKFVEAHLVSVMDRDRGAVYWAVGLSRRRHSGIINNFAFPLLLKYAATSAYLTGQGMAHGRNLKHLAKNCYDSIAQRNRMPMTFDQFYDCLADF